MTASGIGATSLEGDSAAAAGTPGSSDHLSKSGVQASEVPYLEDPSAGNSNAIVNVSVMNCDESTQSTARQSTYASNPSTAQHAVGLRADSSFFRAIVEDCYDDKSEQLETGSTLASPDDLDLNGDEPYRGDTHNQDAASLAVSGITTTRSEYTVSAPKIMNRLLFSSLGLHGRKNEMELLNGCFDRYATNLAENDRLSSASIRGAAGGMKISSSIKASEVVFISGESGTGKTTLAESIKERVARCGGTYVTGKFDLKLRGPYFGIISLFRELCGEMLELRRQDNNKYQELCQSIISDVGAEIVLLTNIVPVLEEALEIPVVPGAVSGQSNKEAKERLQYAFLQFFRVISRYFHHLVIVLDDLQWTDAPSIELLGGIINDRNIHVMVIGIYRSNEVDGAHYLTKTIRDMHGKKKKRWNLTEISIGNLDATICEDILVQLLHVESSTETLRLAAICHKHTAGNAFHYLAYLAMLQEQKLLELDSRSNKWTWDPDQIEEETDVSSNVVELIKVTITKQPQKVKDLLQLVSCLGTSFEKHIVLCAFPHMHGTDPNLVERVLDDLLLLAVREAFLERQGESRYRWVHDSVQAAAMQQISEAETTAYKFKLGKVLLQCLCEKDVEINLFEIVNLLSANEVCPVEDKMIMLDLYLRAAKKAVRFSSFESCVNYAEKGISLLPPDKWSQEREISLELFSLIVEAYFSLANIDQMKVYGDEVLQQPTLTELEKVRVHSCNLSLVGHNMNKAGEALDMSIAVLRKLGCKFPRNKLLQARLALSSLATTKLPTEKEIADLPLMNDPTRKACMEIMVNAATFSHHCNNDFAFIMLTTRMVRWTMQYGVDVYSAPAFAIFGMVKKLFSYEKGALYSDRGFQLLDICSEGKKTESRVTYVSWFMVYPWSKPIHSTLSHLLRGYKAGLEVGDVESAMWSISMYICSSNVAGMSLKPLAVDCLAYIEQMKTLKQDYIYQISLPFAQGVLNMLGDAEDPLQLSGSAMVEEDYLAMIETSEARVMSFLHFQIFKNIMCNFFGDFEQGAKLALERGDEYEKKNGSPLAMIDTLHQGISLYAMARRTKEKRYIKAAKRVKSRVASWVKKGNVNAEHYVPFLEAEDAALEGRSDDAKLLYPRSIAAAASAGFQQNAALASERFAMYLLQDLNDKALAGQKFQECVKYYTDWGSDYKADILKQSFSYLWEEEIPKDISVAFEASGGGSSKNNTQTESSLSTSNCAEIENYAGSDLIAEVEKVENADRFGAIPEKCAGTGKANFSTLGLDGDDKPDRGGVHDDSASMDISALTSQYTKPLARQLSGLVADDGNGHKVNDKEGKVMDDTTNDPTPFVAGQIREGISTFIESRDLLMEGYKAEVKSGDAQGVAFNISLRCYDQWSAYLPLVDLQKVLESDIRVLDELNQKSHLMNLKAYLFAVRRLRNITSEDETNLGFEELLKADTDANVDVFRTVKMMQLELFVQYQDWEGALLCLKEAPALRNSFTGTHASVRVPFLEALVYLKTSKSAPSWLARRKRKRNAVKLLKALHGWMEKGNEHARHFMHILMAECYALEGNVRSTEDNFKAAISTAELGGFFHDKALAHSLACAWYKAEGNDYWANFHFESSQKLYMEWGAISQVETQYIYYD